MSTTETTTRYRSEFIPDDLKSRDRWVGFQITRDSSGRTQKLPLIPGVKGKVHARSDDPRTWRSFATALADAEVRGLYPAYVFAPDRDDFLIDADTSVQPNGEIREDVQELIERLDTYTEVSVSGRGVHISWEGEVPSAQ